MHIGEVTDLYDKKEVGKVQVKFIIDKVEHKTWAYLLNTGIGSLFVPHIGDLVAIDFIGNDMENAVILGAFYNIEKDLSLDNKEDKMKTIITRSKLKVSFNEEKKVVTIETPGKNIIEINDDEKSIKLEDQNKNKIEMTSGGILIDSAKDITLKAKTNIVFDAVANTGNITMRGMNIEASANGSFKAKASASAELSASGQTVVKGGMVMIN